MTLLRDKESVCRGGLSRTTLTQALNVFPLVSIASIPVAYTAAPHPLSDFILPPSTWLLKNIFTATLWNQNQRPYKKPVLFNFFGHLNFSLFFITFSSLERSLCAALITGASHTWQGKKKKKNSLSCCMFCHSWSKWSCDIHRVKPAIPWEAPKPHWQCQELNHNPW